MRTSCLTAILLALCFSVKSQMQNFEIFAPGTTGGNYGSVRYYDPSTVGQKYNKISYTDIVGSPFWDEKWNPAFLILKGGSVVKLKNVKLNLFTSDVLYMDNNGTEMDAAVGMVQKIMFLNEKDTTKIVAAFEAFPDTKAITTNINSNGYYYYHILADGKWKLLELKQTLIRTVPLDAMADKKTETSFFTKTSYAIAVDGNLFPLKSLNYSNIAAIIHPDKNADQWLKDNKIHFRNEQEAAAFVIYCNYQKKQP
jgi:hypothetical protein